MPFLKRRRLGRSYRRKHKRPPANLYILFNGIPVSLRELELWKPGVTKLGIVEALTWIPVFLGMTTEPMCISDMDPEFKVSLKEDDAPFVQAHKAACDELVDLRWAYHKIPEENVEERSAQYDLIVKKHNEVIDLHKKRSMISKLSQ